MSSVLGSPVIEGEVQAPLAHLARELLQQCGPQMQEILQRLPQDRRDQFMAAVSVPAVL
jgi:hypothetical protein